MRMNMPPNRLQIGLILLALLGALQMAGDTDTKQAKKPPAIDLPADDGSANAKWLDKLDDADREALNEKIG